MFNEVNEKPPVIDPKEMTIKARVKAEFCLHGVQQKAGTEIMIRPQDFRALGRFMELISGEIHSPAELDAADAQRTRYL